MPLSTTTRRRPPRAVLAGLLPLVLVTGHTGPATAAGDPGEDPVHKITVTISGAADPFYGDPLTFRVKASTTDVSAGVYQGDAVVVAPVALDGLEATQFSIPTLDRYRAGTTYTLRIDAAGENSAGSKSFSFTPRHIPGQIKVAGATAPRLTVPYSSPVFGVLDPTITTTVRPGGGSMALERGGVVRTRYAIRTDGTFALNDLSMTPGSYEDVEVYYEGDQNYAATPYGAGLSIIDVDVVKMPTTTTSALSAVKVNQGDPVTVLASTASSRADTTADAKGVMEVHAARAGSGEFTKITELPYPGGKQQVNLSLQQWASTHPGSWTIRTVNHGTDIAAGSASDTSLQVVPPGTPVVDTTTELTLGADSATVLGAPTTAIAKVGSVGGAVTAGSVQFSVAGAVVATVPLSAAGTATTSVRAAVVGAQPVSAVYLGTSSYTWSSSARSLTGLRAGTRVTATTPTGSARPGTAVGVRVAATGSAAVPTGTVSISQGGRVIGTVALSGGAASYRLPTLAPGRHTLTVRYPGDARTTASATTAVVTVAKARSVTRATAKRLSGRTARLTVRVTSAQAVTGTVEVRRGATLVARAKLVASSRGVVRVVTRPLPKGASRLTVRYLGSGTVAGSASKAVTVRFR